LVCLAGLPASGKTTLAHVLKKKLEAKLEKFKVKIIDPDIIRASLTSGQFDPSKEQIVRQRNLKQIEQALHEGFIVISDDLNYYSSMRHDLKEICEKAGLFLFIIYISTPLEICLKWNKKRGSPIPDEVIKDIDNKLDQFDRYKWDSPLLSIDMSKVQDVEKTTESLLKKLLSRYKRFLKIEANSKNKESLEINYSQKLDRLTRDLVGEIIQKHNFDQSSKKIAKLRKSFLKKHTKIRTELSKVPELFKKYLNTKMKN